VVLKGSATALAAGQVTNVISNFGVCGGGSSPPGSCGGLTAIDFTQALLPTPVPIAAGQIVQVTVTISFS
jgi:hypothetical protein